MTPYSELTDKQLLRLYVETRDDAAFAEIVRRHRDSLTATARWRFAGRTSRDIVSLAEEAVQDTLITLILRASSIVGQRDDLTDLGPLLRRMVVHRCIELLRRKPPPDTATEDWWGQLIDGTATDPAAVAEHNDALDALRTCAGLLQGQYRLVYDLRWIAGHTLPVIAGILKVAVGTVFNLEKRVITELQACLARQFDVGLAPEGGR